MSASSDIKNRHTKSQSRLSLKEFARNLLKSGDELATAWFTNKTSAQKVKEQKARLDKKGGVFIAMRTAKKSKGGK